MTLLIVGAVLFFVGMVASSGDGLFHKLRNLFKFGGIIVVVVGLVSQGVRQIPAGHVGVQVMFGKVEQWVLYEGLNFVNPLVSINEVETRTRNYTMSSIHDEGTKSGDDGIRVLSKDGLEVAIDLTVLYRIEPNKAPQIFQRLNLDFEDRFIRPLTRTKIRESATGFVATDLFSAKRKEFEDAIRRSLGEDFTKEGFVLENLLVRNIVLPASVKESIERKITAEQDAQRMQYVLEKERAEADRKRVEAQGIADAQKIMSEGLNDRVLQYEQIKVQKELVNSPNSKIIMVGRGGSAPFIIGSDK